MGIPSYIDNMSEWKDSFSYRYPLSVRFSETDAFGHMNNTVAFVYFETGRINFFKDIGLSKEWFSSGGKMIPVTADLQCDYIRQIFFDQQLHVCVKVAHIGNSSVDLHYMVVNEKEEVCLTGRGRMVQLSRETGKPVSWSENARIYLQS
ncbi:acyl-CoA thioesterase [Evansella sp. AB-rgal1]|uniref:acyl-CoA thioesterase n=1 Tax=Evansella sp. AB-rgal1 TaxID=3242696 RepID=UPI00359DC021